MIALADRANGGVAPPPPPLRLDFEIRLRDNCKYFMQTWCQKVKLDVKMLLLISQRILSQIALADRANGGANPPLWLDFLV